MATDAAVEIQTLFIWRYSFIISCPPSRPKPDRLYPPNGDMKLFARYVFTHTVPAWRRSDIFNARLMLAVHTPAGATRLVSERSSDDFIEIRLDTSGARPQVTVHVERVRGKERFEDDQPVRAGVLVEHLTEEDVLDALADVLGALV